MTNNNLTVTHKIDASANGFLQLILIGLIICLATNDGRAVLQDSEEVATAYAVVLNSFHYQAVRGLTAAHVIEVGIDAHNGIVGFTFMLCLSGPHLVFYAGHLPTRSIVIGIVGKYLDIIAAHINSCRIVDNLLLVCGKSIVDLLCHARSKRRATGREYGIVGIICRRRIRIVWRRIIGLGIGAVVVTRELKEIVGKGVHASNTDVSLGINCIACFQCIDKGVGTVFVK